MAENLQSIAATVGLITLLLKRRGFDVMSVEPLGDGRFRVTAVTNTLKIPGGTGDKMGEILTRLKFAIANLFQIPMFKVEYFEEITKVSEGWLSGKYKVVAVVTPLWKK